MAGSGDDIRSFAGVRRPKVAARENGGTITVLTIAVDRLSKRYGPTVAVRDASFVCHAGRAHALLGENGAGKSTMVNILAGVVSPDSGTIRIGEDELHLRSPRDARRAGIGTAFQELTLIPSMTVAENLLLTEEPLGRLRLVARRALNANADAILDRYGLDGIDPQAKVGALPLSVQQKLEVVRAATHAKRVCLFDESTSALTSDDVEWFAGCASGLREAGVALVFITHRLPEIRRFCQDVTVLRHGTTVGTWGIDEVTDDDLVSSMLGEPLTAAYPPRPRGKEDSAKRPIVINARHISHKPELLDVSLHIREGEIVGIAALQGQGQEALFGGLFGDVPLTGGTLEITGRSARLHSPKAAIRSGRGIGLVPEDRKTDGLFLALPGTENLTISSLGSLSTVGILRRRKELTRAREVMRMLDVTPHAITQAAETLSGGNQQKLVIGRWLLSGSQLLLLYDPTRGVDVGTKKQIYDLLREHASRSGAVLWYSTDVVELERVCDRIIVLYAGEVVTEVRGQDTTASEILTAMLHRGEGRAAARSRPQSEPHSRAVTRTRRPVVSWRMPGLPAIRRERATLLVLALALILFVLKSFLQGKGITLAGLEATINDSLPVGIAAMGETLVLLVGGFDLSAGSILSLLNVLLATQMAGSFGSQTASVVLALVLGSLLGLVNGVLVVWLRLQPIIATLAVGFVWSGVALEVLGQPGGNVPDGFINALTGTTGGVFPNAIIVGLIAICAWLVISRSRLGTRIYAVGSDRKGAAANGIHVGRTLVAAYTAAGLFYGIAAVFLTAQTAGGDPDIGGPILLTLFVAAAVGGASFSGGRGTAIASLIGGFVLDLIGEVLFVLGVNSYYTDIFDGVVLIVAVAATLVTWRGRQRVPHKRTPAGGPSAGAAVGPPVGESLG